MASKKKKKEYEAVLTVLGKKYTGKGETAREAIESLNPGNIKGRGILSMSKGKKKKERVLMPPMVMRLFNTRGLSRDVALKNASMLFDL